MIKVKTVPLAIIAIAGIFGGVALSQATGYWRTTSSKEPAKFKTGDLSGLPNPADIRGSYTWLDVEKAFGVPAAEAAASFSMPGHVLKADERVSVLEELYASVVPSGYEIGTGAVRAYVALYTGLPMDIESDTLLPDAAVSVLMSRPQADSVLLGRLKLSAAASAAPPAASAVPASPVTQTSSQPAPQTADATPTVTTVTTTTAAAPALPAGTGTGAGSGTATGTGTGSGSGAGTTAASTRTIVGKTTFGDLYSWGLTAAQVEQVTGFKPGARAQSVRDAASAAGIEFSSFKTQLQELVDKLPK